MSTVIGTLVDDKINQILQPVKVLITKKYDDRHVDVKTIDDEVLTYVLYVGNPVVNKYGILIFLENNEAMVIG